ncbi:MAG: hypothetical protein J7J91_08230 [Deltaproteobacteria bacterium]|nr:hypothetical protein [Deltaproteobacteria bacterium]
MNRPYKSAAKLAPREKRTRMQHNAVAGFPQRSKFTDRNNCLETSITG